MNAALRIIIAAFSGVFIAGLSKLIFNTNALISSIIAGITAFIVSILLIKSGKKVSNKENKNE